MPEISAGPHTKAAPPMKTPGLPARAFWKGTLRKGSTGVFSLAILALPKWSAPHPGRADARTTLKGERRGVQENAAGHPHEYTQL